MSNFFSTGVSIQADKRDLFTSKFESALLRYNVRAYFGPINKKKYCPIEFNHLSLKTRNPHSRAWDLKMAKKLVREGVKADGALNNSGTSQINSHEVITLEDDGTPQRRVGLRRTKSASPEIIVLDETPIFQHVALSRHLDISTINLADDSVSLVTEDRNNDSDIQIISVKNSSPVKRKAESDVIVLSSNVKHVKKKRKTEKKDCIRSVEIVTGYSLKDQEIKRQVSNKTSSYYAGQNLYAKLNSASQNLSDLKTPLFSENSSNQCGQLENFDPSGSTSLNLVSDHLARKKKRKKKNKQKRKQVVKNENSLKTEQIHNIKLKMHKNKTTVFPKKSPNQIARTVKATPSDRKGGRLATRKCQTPGTSSYYATVNKAVNNVRRSPRLAKRFLASSSPMRVPFLNKNSFPTKILTQPRAFQTNHYGYGANVRPKHFNGKNIFNPNPIEVDPEGLRPIVIDGCNVAFQHGLKKFSEKGVELCVDYFHDRGHEQIKVFFPQHFKDKMSEKMISDLSKKCSIVFTPSIEINGVRKTPYDDRFIVQYAVEVGGVIVSRDNYRDLMLENPGWRSAISERLLMPTFADDLLMFPLDPLGKTGPSLEQFLRF